VVALTFLENMCTPAFYYSDLTGRSHTEFEYGFLTKDSLQTDHEFSGKSCESCNCSTVWNMETEKKRKIGFLFFRLI
jgi:hypothetical protein